MKNWIENFILDSQVRYASVSSTPYYPLKHLLFTNGNGLEIDEEGNFIRYSSDENGKTIITPFNEIYKEDKSWEDIKKDYEKSYDYKDYYKFLISNEKHFFMEDNEGFETLEDYVKDIMEKEYKEILKVSSLNFNEWLKEDKIMDTFLNKHEYSPFMELSPEYFKAHYFTEKTDKELIKISILFSKGLIKLFEYYIDNEDKIINPLTIDPKPEDPDHIRVVESYKNDIKILTNLITKWEMWV